MVFDGNFDAFGEIILKIIFYVLRMVNFFNVILNFEYVPLFLQLFNFDLDIGTFERRKLDRVLD
jgi:hypothetical protein